MIYLDHASTTPLRSGALHEMTEMLPFFGNPSSVHTAGMHASRLLGEYKDRVAHCLGCDADELVFVSSGTEANALALHGRGKIAISAIEHASVYKNARDAKIIPVRPDGVIDIEKAKEIIPRADFVSVQSVNNELGTVMPVHELGILCREANVLFHTDAVQAVGHMPLSLRDEPIDLLSLSAHKFGGPVGIGALYCRRGTPLYSIWQGGMQERGMRAGTESLLLACGMAAALEEAVYGMEQETRRLQSLKRELTDRLAAFGGMPVTESETVASVLSVRFEGMDAQAVLHALDLQGVCVSAGAACHANQSEPSHVLTAMGMTAEQANSCLRISFGHTTSHEDIDALCDALSRIVKQNTSI